MSAMLTGSAFVTTPLAASALEGLGILGYAALVYFVLRLAARWADRALDEPDAPSTVAKVPPSPKGQGT